MTDCNVNAGNKRKMEIFAPNLNQEKWMNIETHAQCEYIYETQIYWNDDKESTWPMCGGCTKYKAYVILITSSG